MIVEVWYATKKQFTKDASEHVHVADVELLDDTNVLEMAYELTNHIDCPWWEK